MTHPTQPGAGSPYGEPVTTSPTAPTGDPLTDPLTESVAPADHPWTEHGTTSSGGGDDQGTVEQAKETAQQAKESAKGAATQVAGTAKEQASQVAGETKRQAKDLLHQGRTELHDQAQQQQQRAADGLRTLGTQLGSMADSVDQPGLAQDLAREVSDRAQALSGWLESRDPGSLLEELRGFARQRPMAFLAISAGAGALVGRLGRGVQADASSGSGQTSGTGYAGGTGYGYAGAGTTDVMPATGPATTSYTPGETDFTGGTGTVPGLEAGTTPPGSDLGGRA